jgi:hypothetical protein
LRFEDGWLQFDLNLDGVADIPTQRLGVIALRAEELWL